ncbi:DUF3299 domain-containing protein [Tropicimonas sp. TH_r6]|uniref:DUF3299 domain-containing protein n=1 Tax=Tropicimonas sp. TH_r6 TaxID=3082085 RepID=UPI002954C57C|nr:DUF3299 domain-containing protein [Tropicimonas sp. TH_r6]MDV7145655.1 DUF3299 domain-containing protein [Tropicimonas sp. TH_r6]
MKTRFALCLLCYALPGSVAFAAPEPITWADLKTTGGATETVTDLTKGLSIRQKVDLQVVRDYAGKASGSAADPTVTSDAAMAATLRLGVSGVDVPDLLQHIAERENALFESQLSTQQARFDAQDIAITGHLIAIGETAGGKGRFLLVPFVGACSHTPVPAYQTVIVETDGTFRPGETFQRVTAAGPVEVAMHRETAFIVDGMVHFTSAYTIANATITPASD